jgi:hypothetical protein
VLAVVTRKAVDDYFHQSRLTNSQRNLLVESNIEQFGRVISTKYAANDLGTYHGTGGQSFAIVTVTEADIRNSGEVLNDSVLEFAKRAGFAAPDGRVFTSQT